MDELLTEFYLEKEEKRRLELINLMMDDYKNILEKVLINILENTELRNNAYILNVMSKKKKIVEYLDKHFSKNHFNILSKDADPKTRKNLYVLMGNFINKDYVMDLIKCLKTENINYCISSLILSLGNYNIKNIEEILNKYKEILLRKLQQQEIEEVHYNEILNSINKVIGKNIKLQKHDFMGLYKEETIFLTCMEPLINATFSDVKKHFTSAKKIKNGIIIKTNNYQNVFKIRTFYEALITWGNNFNLDFNNVLENIYDFLASDFMFKTHKQQHAFNYRIEIVTEKNKEEKLSLYNQINANINNSFNNKYINNPSNYEFEIRLIDNGDTYDVFYKLYTYLDKRYEYREKDLPASINPTSASIMLNEVKDYLRVNAKVLDPFCGTSTILVERNFISNSSLYGVDINENAIQYSKINTKKAGVNVNLYNINCLEHIGYYDEIISNMPYGNRVSNHKKNELLYKQFINRLPTLLNEKGVAILLTSEISLMKRLLKNQNKLKLIKDIYMETGGLTPHLFVIKKV